MTTIRAPLCVGCQRLHADRAGFTCDAYPKGIPPVIIQSGVDHRQPYLDDQGLQFLPRDEMAARYAIALFTPVEQW